VWLEEEEAAAEAEGKAEQKGDQKEEKDGEAPRVRQVNRTTERWALALESCVPCWPIKAQQFHILARDLLCQSRQPDGFVAELYAQLARRFPPFGARPDGREAEGVIALLEGVLDAPAMACLRDAAGRLTKASLLVEPTTLDTLA
jgi:hypothetical protein